MHPRTVSSHGANPRHDAAGTPFRNRETNVQVHVRAPPPAAGPPLPGAAGVRAARAWSSSRSSCPCSCSCSRPSLDLGRLALAELSIENAAREGAFQAAKTPGDIDNTKACPADASSNLVICRVQLEAKASGVTIAPADVSVSCSVSGCPTGLGNQVTVEVIGHFQLLTPILAPFFGGTQAVTFTRSATNQIETLPVPATAPPISTSTPTTAPTATPIAQPDADAGHRRPDRDGGRHPDADADAHPDPEPHAQLHAPERRVHVRRSSPTATSRRSRSPP